MKITDLLYDTLGKDERVKRAKVAHYPSSASIIMPNGKVVGTSLIDQFLSWKDVPPSNPPTAQKKLEFMFGDAKHEVIAKILSKANVKAMSEASAKYQHPKLKYPISYRTDNIIEANGEVIVVEVKTSEGGYRYIENLQNDGPKLGHVLQVVCYLEMVPGARRGKLLYLVSPGPKLIEFEILKTSEGYECDGDLVTGMTFEKIIDRWVSLEDYLHKDVRPDMEFKGWISPTGTFMKVKTIDHVSYKSDWELDYSAYRDYLILDPNNEKFTYNYEFAQRGVS